MRIIADALSDVIYIALINLELVEDSSFMQAARDFGSN
jgi:hypothetical protein